MADVAAKHGAATQVGAIFKEVYGEKIAEQSNRMAWIYNFFDKSSRDFGGKYWTAPAHFEGGQSVGSYDEDELLGDARAETLKEMQIKPKMHYAILTLTGLAMAASKGNLKAFIGAKDLEVKNKTKWLIAHLNAQFYQNGKGIVGTVLSFTGSTITMDLTNSNTTPTNMNWFRVGMRVDIYDAAFANRRNHSNITSKNVGYEVTAINKSLNAVTLAQKNGSAAVTGIIATDVVTYEDARISPADSWGKQIMGLDGLIDDVTNGPQTLQNIDRNTFTEFRGNVMRNAGVARPLSLDLMQAAVDVAEAASGQTADFMIMGYGVRRAYLNLLWYDVRYGPQKLAGGFDILKYNNLDVVVDKDCTAGRLYLGAQANIHKYIVQGVGILDQAGAGMERVSHKDVYELLIGAYKNVGSEQPNSWTKLVDILEPAA